VTIKLSKKYFDSLLYKGWKWKSYPSIKDVRVIKNDIERENKDKTLLVNEKDYIHNVFFGISLSKTHTSFYTAVLKRRAKRFADKIEKVVHDIPLLQTDPELIKSLKSKLALYRMYEKEKFKDSSVYSEIVHLENYKERILVKRLYQLLLDKIDFGSRGVAYYGDKPAKTCKPINKIISSLTHIPEKRIAKHINP